MIQIIEKQNRYKFIFFKFFSYSSFNLFLDARHNEHTNAMLEKIKCKKIYSCILFDAILINRKKID